MPIETRVRSENLETRLGDRDAVYPLTAVFLIVVYYKVRRKTKRLLQHAFEFAGLPHDGNAD